MGHVNSRREAIIQFAVLGENNQRQAIKTVSGTIYEYMESFCIMNGYNIAYY
jgi:hypothetical protein